MFYVEVPFGKRFGECSLSRFVIATASVFVWQYTVAPIRLDRQMGHFTRLAYRLMFRPGF